METDVAHQFQAARKLPGLTWIFPNAAHNHEANANAWYTPSSFSPIPVGSSSTPRDEGPDDEQDERIEAEMCDSVEYVCQLIDAEVERGVHPERILVGGFSQGCAISLVLALASRYKGRLGGAVGLSGYLPKGRRVWEGREELRNSRVGEDGDGRMKMKVFLAHGTKDMLVPMRVFRDTRERVRYTVGEEMVESREYEGMGHVASGLEFRDMCGFLEAVLGV